MRNTLLRGRASSDPGAPPRIISLRVQHKARKVLAYDVITDKYVPIELYQGP